MNKAKIILISTVFLLALTGFISYYGFPVFRPFGNSTSFTDSTNYININDGLNLPNDSLRIGKDLFVGSKGGSIYLDTNRQVKMYLDGNDFFLQNNKSGNIYITATANSGNVSLRAGSGGQEYLIGTGSANYYSWNKQEGLFETEIMRLDTVNGLKVTSGGITVFDDTRGFLRFPNLTSTERDALTPSTGMVIYNVTTNKLQCYGGGFWNDLY